MCVRRCGRGRRAFEQPVTRGMLLEAIRELDATDGEPTSHRRHVFQAPSQNADPSTHVAASIRIADDFIAKPAFPCAARTGIMTVSVTALSVARYRRLPKTPTACTIVRSVSLTTSAVRPSQYGARCCTRSVAMALGGWRSESMYRRYAIAAKPTARRSSSSRGMVPQVQ